MAIDLRKLRGPAGFDVLQAALDEMRRCGAAPTLLNLELWAQAAAEPHGPVGYELAQIVAAGKPITEAMSEDLARRHLLSVKLDEELRAAGTQLTRQLSNMTRALGDAQRSTAAYGQVLNVAETALEPDGRSQSLDQLVDTLTHATRHVQTDRTALELRLNEAAREIEQLNESLHIVRREAMTDALTDLANRKAFDDHFAGAVTDAGSSGGALALAIIDIDHFKRFNDTWGHQTGDQVLRYVGSVLSRLSGAPRIVARYGGEEFAVVLPAITADGAIKLLDDLRKEIASRGLKRRSTGEELGAVTVSIGVAAHRAGDTVAALIERADKAMYASKAAGRNRICDYERLRKVAVG